MRARGAETATGFNEAAPRSERKDHSTQHRDVGCPCFNEAAPRSERKGPSTTPATIGSIVGFNEAAPRSERKGERRAGRGRLV